MISTMRARFIIVGSLVFLICAGISAFSLAPSYFVLIANAPGSAPAIAPVSAADHALDVAAISHTKALLTQIAPLAGTSTAATDAITTALSLRPAAVHIDQITYTPGSLMLVGSADTNSAISAYQSALSANPTFTSVSIPVGALVGTDGGRFSVRLSGGF